MQIKEISRGQCLYRYDIQEPPKDWDDGFHNCEYQFTSNGETVYKNQSSLFFFFENEETTIHTAHKAIDSHSKEGFWLTTTTVTGAISLLDLRGGSTLAMLNNLFCTFSDIFDIGLTLSGEPDSKELSTLKSSFEYVMRPQQNTEEYYSNWLELHKPFILPGNSFSLLGQKLSDFNNGPKFKSLLEDLGLDGYIFDECYGSSTICLTKPIKLTQPSKEYFDRMRLKEWLYKYYTRKYGLSIK